MAGQFRHGNPHRHRAAVPHRIQGVFEQFAEQPGPVLEATAVLVAAVVDPAREELRDDRILVQAVEVDDVEADTLGP